MVSVRMDDSDGDVEKGVRVLTANKNCIKLMIHV